ncbi:MAG: ATP-binding cassette domain-containing protein [Cetobacterium sp.]|uniref:ATP-binding cassette domain-containing protein n=1 Tax=Cetobacterium sp. TaxID=2071632 RepID=UPI003F36C393
MIKIKNVKKYYNHRLILDIPYLEFHPGKIYSIIGKNGIGKSTLFRIIFGLETYSEGSIEKPSLENIIFNTQKPLFFNGTVKYNLFEPFKLKNLEFPYSYYESLIKIFNIEFLQESNIKSLSCGEKAKVQFIRTLLFNKDYLLLDEPTASTDKETTNLILKYILKEKEKNKCIIIISHNSSNILEISDETITL